jgi:hypothetical protein
MLPPLVAAFRFGSIIYEMCFVDCEIHEIFKGARVILALCEAVNGRLWA